MSNSIEIIKGDITHLAVEAIVNAANSGLRGGGGVDGAIHKAAGPDLDKECMQIIKKIGILPAGEAVITKGYMLKAKYVIHTVGPVWEGGMYNEDKILANAYMNSLKLALENNIRTIAFPNISTGIYGFPKDRAAGIAINEIDSFIAKKNFFKKIIIVCYDDDSFSVYNKYIGGK